MDYRQVYAEWLEKAVPYKAELEAVCGDDIKIKESFSMPLEFGTAGMRGIIGAGTGKINVYTVRRATAGLARYVKQCGAAERGVVISYDTRKMSYEFAMETAKTLSFYRIKCYVFNDVRPVPVCSFAVRELNAFAGVMITASHNPKEYNGYKVYGEDGAQMSPEATAKVVNFIDDEKDYFAVRTANGGIAERSDVYNKDGEYLDEFIQIIGKSVDDKYYARLSELSLSPDAVKEVGRDISVVYTPLHGAGYVPVTSIFNKMRIPYNVVEEQRLPDPDFSTVSMPNPEQPEALKLGVETAKKLKSDIVIGTDPDCDRMGVAIRDENGKFILLTGNQIGAMLMFYILSRKKDTGKLPSNGAIVKTIVTTNLASDIAASFGVSAINVLTGFKFIGEKIKLWEKTGEYTFLFGYEESYGYLSGTHARDKDAVVSAMLFAEMACYYESIGIKLHALLNLIWDKYGYFSEVSKSVTFAGLDGMDKMSAIMNKLETNKINNIAGYQVKSFENYNTGVTLFNDGTKKPLSLPKANVLKYILSDSEWVCVRPSGTEPKLKIYVSVKDSDMEKAQRKQSEILKFMEKLI